MHGETILFVRTGFWLLAAVTICLPRRYAVLAYLLLVQFDVTGVTSYSANLLGIENAIKVVAIPTFLLLRVRPVEPFDKASRNVRHLWLGLASIACMGALWSPYPLSALKMIGYMYAATVLFVLFTSAWRRGWLEAKTLAIVLLISLVVAVIQTFVLANDYGDYTMENRFTSFAAPQSFAAFLLSAFAILLFSEQTVLIFVAECSAFVGIVLTGSRSIFLGGIFILIIRGFFSLKYRHGSLHVRAATGKLLLPAVVVIFTALLLINYLPQNRLNEAFAASIERQPTLQDVGTFYWRLSLYSATLRDLDSRTASDLLLGTGTSSGGRVILENGILPEETLDPNRALHDEFLRSLYEWGLPGFALLGLFITYLAIYGLGGAAQDNSVEAWTYIAIFVPFLISLTVENVFAESAGPEGVGYAIGLTSLFAARAARERNTHSIDAEVRLPRGTNTATDDIIKPNRQCPYHRSEA